MKILFVLDNISSNLGANVSGTLSIINELKEDNDIYIVAKSTKEYLCDYFDDFERDKVFIIDAKSYFKLVEFGKKKVSLIKRLFTYLLHFNLLFSYLDAKLFNFYFITKKYIKMINRICKNLSIDLVITTIAPYYLINSLTSSRINCIKSVIQMDPYTNNFTLKRNKKNKRKIVEIKNLHTIDKLFLLDFLENDMKKEKILDGINYSLIGYPGINEKLYCSEMNNLSSVNKKINFLFAGRFYEDIRNPKFLLELFVHLPNYYVLHLVGGGAERIIDDYKNVLGQRLVLYGWKSKEEVNKMINKMDVMVNLNNKITNQMSSKIFENISTGKPILNICLSNDCPSLEYMKKYNNSFSIVEQELSDNIINEVIVYFDSHLYKRESFECIKENFKLNISKNIANTIINEIELIKKENKNGCIN